MFLFYWFAFFFWCFPWVVSWGVCSFLVGKKENIVVVVCFESVRCGLLVRFVSLFGKRHAVLWSLNSGLVTFGLVVAFVSAGGQEFCLHHIHKCLAFRNFTLKPKLDLSRSVSSN